MAGQYVPNSQALVPKPSSNPLTAPATYPPPGSYQDPKANALPPRPEWTDVKAMQFWSNIFEKAISKFKSTVPEPRGRPKMYSIRDKIDWDDVYGTLELARTKYREGGGPVGWLRKVRRKAANNITPFAEVTKIASKVVPMNPYSTPVLGAVEVLLDAVKNAANVRTKALDGFDGLIPIFSDVELFLGTFRGDMNIKNAAVDLTAETLNAIEQAIGFFIKNTFSKGAQAIVMGEDYEKRLLQSLEMIDTRSKNLMTEATKSHIHDFQMYSQETMKLLGQLVRGQRAIANSINSFEHLLSEHIREKERLLEAARQEIIFLRVENGILRSASPMPSNPVAAPTQIEAEWYMNQEAIRRILDTPDLDFGDMDFIADKREQLPSKQRAQAEQAINTQLFRDWIVSAASAKLLIQWDSRRPKTIAEVSPLSIFCTDLIRALQAKERFMAVKWFCGLHVEAGPHTGGRAMLASLIDQLLRQHFFDTRQLHQEINLSILHERSLDMLMDLFGWLVRQLPRTITLFCIVDGVVLYEREEFCDESIPVLAHLLSLTADTSMAATVKVLFTSTPGTDVVRAAFEDANLILNVDTVPRLTWVPSEERMARELGGLDEHIMEYQE